MQDSIGQLNWQKGHNCLNATNTYFTNILKDI